MESIDCELVSVCIPGNLTVTRNPVDFDMIAGSKIKKSGTSDNTKGVTVGGGGAEKHSLGDA